MKAARKSPTTQPDVSLRPADYPVRDLSVANNRIENTPDGGGMVSLANSVDAASGEDELRSLGICIPVIGGLCFEARSSALFE